MPIDFHSQDNRFSYTARQADSSWRTAISEIVDVRSKQVADIGCGGGIYAQALIEMGATSLTCLDFSEAMLKGAREHCREYTNIDFVLGNALSTGLPDEQYDLVLERALIHHVAKDDIQPAFAEAFRLLAPGGTLIVQDRTPEDCLLPGSTTNIRGYFFSCYPKLSAKEIARRLDSGFVLHALQQAGFQAIEERKLWEVRKVYPNSQALVEDLLARTGRSILHELTDAELWDLTNYIQEQLQENNAQAIVEQDRWTVWSARKAGKR